MAMQVVEVDVDDWEAAVSRLVVRESALIGMINARLTLEAPWLRCKVAELRMTPSDKRNWAVAKFELEPADYIDQKARFAAIARIAVEVGEGYEVDWPATIIQ